MPKYLLRRFAEMLITLFLIATATFFLLEAVPGDPLTERASKLSICISLVETAVRCTNIP